MYSLPTINFRIFPSYLVFNVTEVSALHLLRMFDVNSVLINVLRLNAGVCHILFLFQSMVSINVIITIIILFYITLLYRIIEKTHFYTPLQFANYLAFEE